MRLALDIGNTNTKFGLFDNRALTTSGIIGEARELSRVIENNEIEIVVISSVQPEIEAGLRSVISAAGVPVTTLTSAHDYGFTNEYKTRETLGIDRLCGIAGALELTESSGSLNLKRERFVITIDCGTATTINVLDGKRFIGGIIMPGMMTMAKSLNLNTAQLPEVVPAGDVPLIGASTIECIKSGIVNSTVGLIDRIVNELRLDFNGYNMFLTGGNTQYLRKSLKYNFIENENLVLYGVNRMAEKFL